MVKVKCFYCVAMSFSVFSSGDKVCGSLSRNGELFRAIPSPLRGPTLFLLKKVVLWNPLMVLFNDCYHFVLERRVVQTLSQPHPFGTRTLDCNPNVPGQIVTAGDDLKIRFWDTRKLTEPLLCLPSAHSHWWVVRGGGVPKVSCCRL